MGHNPHISIVIPSYNRKRTILTLIENLLHQDHDSYEIIIVDDCSPDDSADTIEAVFPSVKVIRCKTNGGPAVARNAGIRLAQGDIIVGFDSDVSIDDLGLLRRIESEFNAHPKASGFAFRVRSPDGLTDDKPRWWHPRDIEKSSSTIFETDYFSGTAYSFKKSCMIESGLFPEFLYMHYEEVELAYRMVNRSFSILYNPYLIVRHHADPTPRRSRIRDYFKPRNQILIAISCFPPKNAIAYLIPRLALGFIRSLRFLSFGQFCAALLSAIKLCPLALKRRDQLSTSTLRRIKEFRNHS